MAQKWPSELGRLFEYVLLWRTRFQFDLTWGSRSALSKELQL